MVSQPSVLVNLTWRSRSYLIQQIIKEPVFHHIIIMPLELSELTLEEALRSYSSVKGHRTRCKKEIGNLLELLKAQYSATSEKRINDRLEKLEKHTHRLSDIAEYLVTLKYAKARNHRDEVADFTEILDKCSEEIFTMLHNRHSAAPVSAATSGSCSSSSSCF